MKVKIKILVTVFVLFLFVGNVGFNNPAQAQRGRCGDEARCITGELFDNCLPLPTSLPAVSTSWSGRYGFRVASNNCGAKKCYWLFACVCGPPLAGEFCPF